MATVMSPQDQLAAMFDAYRPTASDADRQAFADDLVAQLRQRVGEVQDDPQEGDEPSLSELVEQLGATPVTDASFDGLLMSTRRRFLDQEGA